jgi:hypothetical protein
MSTLYYVHYAALDICKVMGSVWVWSGMGAGERGVDEMECDTSGCRAREVRGLGRRSGDSEL